MTQTGPVVDAPERDRPTPQPVRWAAFTLALLVTIMLGRTLVIPETGLALYWPAGGVAVLGVAASRSATELRVVLVTIFVLATLGNVVTGVQVQAAVALGLANVALGLVPALWLHVAPGRLRSPYTGAGTPLGGALGLTHPADLLRISVAVALGALASAVPGALAMTLMNGAPSAQGVAAWVIRLGVGAFIFSVPLLTLTRLTGHDGAPGQPTRAADWVGWLRAHGVETLTLLVAATSLVAAIFGPRHDLPLTYLPLLISVWAGVRLPPVVAGLITLWVGLMTASAALFLGGGPFADVTTSAGRAMTVQGYAVLLVAVAMLLSLVIAERDRLSEELALAQVEATRRADDLAVVTQTVPVGLMIVRPGLLVEMANPAARAIAEDLVDDEGRFAPRWRRPDGSLLPLEDYPSNRAARGTPCRDLIVLDGPPGAPDTRTWSVDAVRLPRRPGDGPRSLLALRNVTDVQQHLAQLEAFAGVVAHDLQNPVTAARGWLDVAVEELEAAGLGNEMGAGRAVERARGATDRAAALINDLLEYSVGRTAAIRREEVDLDVLGRTVVAGVEQAYADRDPLVDLGPLGQVVGDRVLLSQLLTNIVGNAVKYTPPGRVPEVTISAVRTGEDVELTVSDRGIGVPETHRQSVFEPFNRAHGHDGRFTGTGLGLAICAQAARRHGGDVRVEPRDDGEGSRFVVTLPHRVTGAGTTGPPTPREPARAAVSH